MVKSILDNLARRELNADEGAEVVLKDLSLLPEIVKGVSSANKRIKNACAKILRTVSEKYPIRVYRHFDMFVGYMDGDDTILKWLAMDTIANMARIDTDNRIDGIIHTYYELLSDESMITAAHAIESLAVIAKARPEHRNRITRELLRVKIIERGSECRNILLGKVILAFEGYMTDMSNNPEVVDFVRTELKNTRRATAKKAEHFLKTAMV